MFNISVITERKFYFEPATRGLRTYLPGAKVVHMVEQSKLPVDVSGQSYGVVSGHTGHSAIVWKKVYDIFV